MFYIYFLMLHSKNSIAKKYILINAIKRGDFPKISNAINYY